jgi:hypothetical protein
MQDENAGTKGSESHGNDQMPLAIYGHCRGHGGCELGYKASWRYVSTKPDPFTSFHKTKMDWLTKPMKENGFKPPVKAYGDDGARFIVGPSMCAYVRSLQIKPRVEMTDQKKKARKIKAARNARRGKADEKSPAAVTPPPAPVAVAPVAPVLPPIPLPPPQDPPTTPPAPKL